MKKALFLFFTLSSFISFGQSWVWGRQAKSQRYNSGGQPFNDHNIAVDKAGNSYIIGSFEGKLSFGSDTLIATGCAGVYLVKYDASGNVLWARQVNELNCYNSGQGASVALDKSDNVYITGQFSQEMYFGADTLKDTITYNWDMYTAKYDANGNILWAKQAVNLNYYSGNLGQSIAVDAFGNALVTGSFLGLIAFNGDTLKSPNALTSDVFLVRYDPSGNLLWARQSVTPSVYSMGWAGSVAVDNNGNAYITGNLEDTISFGPFTLTAPGIDSTANMFLVKYDVNGNVIWANQSNTTGRLYGAEGFSTAVDGAGGIYVTGLFNGTVSFGLDTLKETNIAGDVFLTKYNTNGNVIWAKQAYSLDSNSYAGYSIVCDTLKKGGGHLLIGHNGAGSAPYKVEFGADTFNLNNYSPHGISICLQFDSDANVPCGMIFNRGFDWGASIGVDKSGAYTYLAGAIDTITVFGPDTLTMWGTTQPLPFVARWQNCCANNYNEPICIATIDTANNKAEVIWGRTNSPPEYGYGSYNIYRDSSSFYVLKHSQPLDSLSEYVDLTSNPSVGPVSYKLSTTDSCGESALSSPHTTIFLVTTANGAGTYHLNWTPYVGFTPTKYRIFRGPALNAMAQIDSVPNTTSNYTDSNAPLNSYYAIEAVSPFGICVPTARKIGNRLLSSQLSGSFSNGFNTRILGIQNISTTVSNLNIYPNPNNGTFSLDYSLSAEGEVKAEILNELGQIVYSKTEDKNSGNVKEKIDLENLSSGIYSLRLQTNDGVIVRKIALIGKN